MKILITGSKGFLGEYLVNKFKYEHTIYTISRTKDNNNRIEKNFVGDLSNSNFVNSINLEVDFVINCAANTNHYEEFSRAYKDNCKSVINLIKSKSLSYKRLIHISTEAVFLSNSILNISENSNYPKKNLTSYSKTKMLSELFVKKYSLSYNKQFNIIRTRLIWDSKKSPVFKKLHNAIKKKIFFLVNNGNYLTSATNIENLAAGIANCLKFGVDGKIYFITDGKHIKFYVLINKILGTNNSHTKIISLPRKLVYCLCYVCEYIYIYSKKKIKPPLSLSLYYLTMSQVIINDDFSKKELKLKPKNYY